MAEKSKTREITIIDEGGTFNAILRRFTKVPEYDFEGISITKSKKPKSIYELAKMLKRDFKSVSDDVKQLEKFGFLDMISESTGKRERLRPVLVVDSMHIHLKL